MCVLKVIFMATTYFTCVWLCIQYREETEIIEGEVVEIQIDRPTTTSVSRPITLQHCLILCMF